VSEVRITEEGTEERQTVSSNSETGVLKIRACNLKITASVNQKMISKKSTVGGGKLFRQSHVNGPAFEKKKAQAKTSQGLNWRNELSLSDIESINSEEEREATEEYSDEDSQTSDTDSGFDSDDPKYDLTTMILNAKINEETLTIRDLKDMSIANRRPKPPSESSCQKIGLTEVLEESSSFSKELKDSSHSESVSASEANVPTSMLVKQQPLKLTEPKMKFHAISLKMHHQSKYSKHLEKINND